MSDRARTLLLLLFVLLALLAGFTAGYRARISQEEIMVYPNGRFLPPVPPNLSVVLP